MYSIDRQIQIDQYVSIYLLPDQKRYNIPVSEKFNTMNKINGQIMDFEKNVKHT